jgi:hypothetical protein
MLAFGKICCSKAEPFKKSDAAKIKKEFLKAVSSNKKKTGAQGNVKPVQLKKGTTVYHIMKLLKSVMDILDSHGIKKMFIVMDNCSIHHSRFVVDAINNCGYKSLFMPLYSPFLNLIEEC